jgi:hypothetical protein
MGSMSSDAAPLPRLGEVFFDVRGSSRSMRLSWYANTGIAVFSIWQGGTCTGTFRLPLDDLSRLVESLGRGLPDGPADVSAFTGPIPLGGQRPRLALGAAPFEPFTGAMSVLSEEQAAAYGFPRPPQNGAPQNGAPQNGYGPAAGLGQAYGYEANGYPPNADYATDPSVYNQNPTTIGVGGPATGPQQFGPGQPVPGGQYGAGVQYGPGQPIGPGQQFGADQQQAAPQYGAGQHADPQQYEYAAQQYGSAQQPSDPQYPTAPEYGTDPQYAAGPQQVAPQFGTGPYGTVQQPGDEQQAVGQYGVGQDRGADENHGASQQPGNSPYTAAQRHGESRYGAAQEYGRGATYGSGPQPADAQDGAGQFGAGQYGQAQQSDAQQYGFGQQGVDGGAAAQAAGAPFDAMQNGQTQYGAQYGAGQPPRPEMNGGAPPQDGAQYGAGPYGALQQSGAGATYGVGEQPGDGQRAVGQYGNAQQEADAQFGTGQYAAGPAHGAGENYGGGEIYGAGENYGAGQQPGNPEYGAAQQQGEPQYGTAQPQEQTHQYGLSQQQGDAQYGAAEQAAGPQARYGTGQYGQAQQQEQGQYNSGQYGDAQQYGSPQQNGSGANHGAAEQDAGAQYAAGQYGQTPQQGDAQQYGFGQQGQAANDGPDQQTADAQYGATHNGQQNGAGQYGTGPLYAVGQQAASQFSGPQPVPGFQPSPPSTGQPAAQSYQPQPSYPAEQHHEQASTGRSYDGQPSYDDLGYDDQGYAAPGREQQIPPGLEFSANFGNRGYSLYGDAAEADAASPSGQARRDGHGVPAGQQGQSAGHALAGQQGASAEEESAAAQYSQFGPLAAGQPQRASAAHPQQAQEGGRFPQFAQSLATLSAPVAADAAAGGHWPPGGTQSNSSTGAYPAYEAAQAQSAYQDQPAYYGGSGPDTPGGAASGANGYGAASTGGQPTAPVPPAAANGYAYPEAGRANTGEYRPAPGGPPSGGLPTFTPTYSPDGAASSQNGAVSQAGAPNGNGRGARPGQPSQPSQSPSGAYPEISPYPSAPRGGSGEPDRSYPPVPPGYPNGAGYAGTGSYPVTNGQDYASGAQPDWRDGYPPAAQRPFPGGPGQGYHQDEYADQAGHSANGAAHDANGYAFGQQTGPLAATEHPSSPSYAPPDQFDPSQQGYWQ